MNTKVPATTRGDATRADASKLTTTKSSAPAWKAIAPIAVAVVLALLPAPSGLPHHAWYFFSIFVGVIVGLVLEPLPGAAIAIIGITVVAVLAPFVLFSPQQLSAPGFRPPSAALNWALSGYSNPTVWLIFGAFILALGYERTGLGERIALLLVKRMGKSTLLLGSECLGHPSCGEVTFSNNGVQLS
jgi:L-tartrate/succinate antiporter